MSFDIVRGDLGPSLAITLTVSGAAQDVSTADSVELHWVKPDGTVMLDDLTEVDATEGQFEMVWEAGDTDQIGAHLGQVIVTSGSVVETYPSDGSMIIWFVNPQVGDC